MYEGPSAAGASRHAFGAAHVAALALLVQPLVWVGAGTRLPWGFLGLDAFVAGLWGLLALALLLAGWPLAARLLKRRSTLERIGETLLLAAPLATVAFDVASVRQFGRFGYRSPASLAVLEAATLAALFLWIRRDRPAGGGALVAALSASAHRALAILLFPLDGRRSDMLTSIVQGLTLLADGTSPYTQVPDRTQGAATWGVMPYLPGTLLAHGPAFLLGVDLRWGGALVLLALSLLFAREVRRSAREENGSGVALRDAELLGAVVLLSPYHAYRHDLYFDSFLAATAFLFWWVARGRVPGLPRLLSVAAVTGLAIASRQWAWVYGPFVLVAASAGAPSRRFAGRLALAATVALAAAAALAGPLVAMDPAAFVRTMLLHVNAPGGELSLGVAIAAERLGVSRALPAVQAAAVAALFLGCLVQAARGRLVPGEVLARGWAALGVAVLLSPFLENYFHLTPAFAAAGLALGAAQAAARGVSSWSPRPSSGRS